MNVQAIYGGGTESQGSRTDEDGQVEDIIAITRLPASRVPTCADYGYRHHWMNLRFGLQRA